MLPETSIVCILTRHESLVCIYVCTVRRHFSQDRRGESRGQRHGVRRRMFCGDSLCIWACTYDTSTPHRRRRRRRRSIHFAGAKSPNDAFAVGANAGKMSDASLRGPTNARAL